MSQRVHEGLLAGHNYTNGKHFYTVKVPRKGVTHEPVFHLEDDEEAMQAILSYNGFSDLTELLNMERLSETKILVKEEDGGYVIAVDEMRNS